MQAHLQRAGAGGGASESSEVCWRWQRSWRNVLMAMMEVLWLFGYWSKLNHQGTAGFCPWFHLPGLHLGYLFLTHSHLNTVEGGQTRRRQQYVSRLSGFLIPGRKKKHSMKGSCSLGLPRPRSISDGGGCSYSPGEPGRSKQGATFAEHTTCHVFFFFFFF